MSAARAQTFDGASGSVSFTSAGQRRALFDMVNVQGTGFVRVGTVDFEGVVCVIGFILGVTSVVAHLLFDRS